MSSAKLAGKKSIKFFASLGIVSGYGHDNETEESPDKIVSKIWQEVAKEEFEKTGIYVGAVISPSLTIYHKDWGCPEGGEKTVLITGECNSEYTGIENFKVSVINVLKKVAESLGQSTTQLAFQEVDFVYLDFRKEN